MISLVAGNYAIDIIEEVTRQSTGQRDAREARQWPCEECRKILQKGMYYKCSSFMVLLK
jgi:hypothetical protein